MSRPLLIDLPIKIRAYDIDVLGIVSNIVYVRWFEDLRTHFLETYYPFQQLLEEKKSPVLSETNVTYNYPLTIHDHPTGLVWLSNVSKSRWECSFEINTEQRTHASGIQTGYFIDTDKIKPVRVPDRFLELYVQAAS